MKHDPIAARVAAGQTHQLNKAVNSLMGIVTGVLADGELTDREIQFLRTWLTEHDAVAESWPGDLIFRAVQEVMFDGVVTADERDYLVNVFRELIQTDFANTGSITIDGPALPVNDQVTVQLTNCMVCHTGEFLFGTRKAVERATERAGGMPVETLTKKTELLVIGTRVSPAWVHTTFGRKIQKAIELQDGGTGIEIISERRWLEALGKVAM